MANIQCTELMGLVIDETQTWDNHIDQKISRVNSVCCATTAVEQCCRGKF